MGYPFVQISAYFTIIVEILSKLRLETPQRFREQLASLSKLLLQGFHTRLQTGGARHLVINLT